MNDRDWLADRFETQRSHLRGVAYRMLGSATEADDAVQEAWLRLSRSDTSGVDNLAAWLTTVVARISLDMLRSRTSRREQPMGQGPQEPQAGSNGHDRTGPEHEALMADSVGLALLVVLDTLTPAERIAFVLHDMFAVPFDEIAPIVDRTPVAAKKLASRARQRVRGTTSLPEADLTRRRKVVDAFLRAARGGDMEGLLAVLDPDVVRRADPAAIPAGVPAVLQGARRVVEETRYNRERILLARVALVDGAPGIVVAPHGQLMLVLRFAIDGDLITEIDVVADPDRLAQLDLAVADP
jgi:RNA polymerase sigma factor (sigma-70 family)